MRAENLIERLIANRIIRDVLAAGHHITVNDGEEDALIASRDEAAIMAAMFTTDEDQLFFDFDPKDRVSHAGWVWLMYGNSGYDVVHDALCDPELTAGADALADAIENDVAVPTLIQLVEPAPLMLTDRGEGDTLDKFINAYCAEHGIRVDGDVFGRMFSGPQSYWTEAQATKIIEDGARVYNLRQPTTGGGSANG